MRAPVVALLLALAACGRTELHTDLSEEQANEMLAVLQTAGVDAEKTALKEGRFSVAAPDGEFAKAVQVLRAQGLPREQYQSLGDIFKKEGFVSSATEERARLNYGLTQELSRTIGTIDGVLQARVHLAIPQPDPLNQTTKPSSASVFVKHRPGVDLVRHTGQIKALVVNAIEGLAYDRVSVVLIPAEPLPAAQPEPEPLVGLSGVLLVGGLAALGGLATLLVGRRRERPRRLVLRP